MEQMVKVDNRIASSKKPASRLTKSGLALILGVIVIVVAILFVLGYRNNIFVNLPFFSQGKSTSGTGMSKEGMSGRDTSKVNLTDLNSKAKKAGYSIVLVNLGNVNNKDTSGRNILASKERVVNGWTDSLWWRANVNIKNDSLKITGIFLRWDVIEGSRDKYLVLTVPSFKGEIKFRILYEGSILNVDNLDYGPKNTSIKPIEKVGNFKDLDLIQLNRLIKAGDIISVYIPIDKTEGETFIESVDKDGIRIGNVIELRRFGGIDTIHNELK
jgi:hypothetical protein